MTEREYEAALEYLPYVLEAHQTYRLDTAILYGVMSRESRCGLALDKDGRGDHGYAHGVMQVDIRFHAQHVKSGDWKDPRLNILYGARLIRDSINYMKGKGVAEPLRPGLAAYNRGMAGVYNDMKRGLDCDAKTTGGNYSTDVLRRAEWFRERLFPPVEDIDPVQILGPEIIPTHKPELRLR